WIAIILGLGPLLALLALSFPYHFALSDGGLYLYNLQFGVSYPSFNPYVLGFSELVQSLDLNLLQVRWLTFLLYVMALVPLTIEYSRFSKEILGRALRSEYVVLFFISLFS